MWSMWWRILWRLLRGCRVKRLRGYVLQQEPQKASCLTFGVHVIYLLYSFFVHLSESRFLNASTGKRLRSYALMRFQR